MATTVQTVNDDVLVSVTEQLRDLQPVKDKQVELADLRGKLEQLKNLLDGTHGIPNDPTIASLMTHKIADPDAGGLVEQVDALMDGSGTLTDLGKVLVSLYALQQLLQARLTAWVASNTVQQGDSNTVTDLLLNII